VTSTADDPAFDGLRITFLTVKALGVFIAIYHIAEISGKSVNSFSLFFHASIQQK
jgi:hypothetical protein